MKAQPRLLDGKVVLVTGGARGLGRQHLLALAEVASAKSSVNEAKAGLNEVKQIRLKYRSLATPAEKPVRIGGSLRGPETKGPGVLPDITPLANDIAATGGFYSRTFTIDHR